MKIKKYSFIDKVFGDEIEYIVINDDKETIIVFEYCLTMNFIKVKNAKELIENLIESKLLTEFLKDTVKEQNTYIEDLETEIELKNKELEG